MAKKIIRLNEGEFRKLVEDKVREELSKVNNNGTVDESGIDISKIDIEVFRNAYRDLRFDPIPVTFDDDLSFPVHINEAYGDILPPDSVVNKILNKYKLDTTLVNKVESNHEIAIYIIVALIGKNIKLIKEDMKKMGYFLGRILDKFSINDMEFVKLKFEPYCQMQMDETDNVKSSYDTLYHWTPQYCVEDILSKGLVPSHQNSVFNYPSRTYMMSGDCDDNEMNALGEKLCLVNKNPKNNGAYVLLAIDIRNLDDSIRFYYDPNSSIGIYTEQVIPKDNVKQVDERKFSTKLKRK